MQQFSMSTEIKLFENNEVRFVTEDDGNFWVVGKDLLRALEYNTNSNPARVFSQIPEDWKGVKPIHTPGGTQRILCLSEQGLYFFLGRSDKPKAIPYQRWIAGEVVPSIRRTGSYSLQQIPKLEQYLETVTTKLEQLAIGFNEIKQENKEIKEELKEVKPKAEFYDLVTQNEGQYDFMDVTAVLNGEGYDIGRNQLFELLRNKNILNKNNKPYRRFVRNGMFKRVICGDAISLKTVATGKGMQFIKKILKRLNNLT